jgi:methanogenic corrinoid protein MtbC1
MKELFTPKQVAKAIQVSESSVKRWCDKDVIPTQYTGGGHRRIQLSALLDFLKSSNHELVRPEVLGLPAATGKTVWVLDRAADQMTEALVRGDEEQCRQITLDLYMAERSIATICDLVFANAFQAIGDRWECGRAEVYQERHGCEIALRILHELRSLVPNPPAGSPLAIGGALEGDQYNLATTMAELVLRDAKWNAMSLGDNLPFETLGAAIKRHRPRIFWLSCSHIMNEDAFISGYKALHEEFGLEVAFAVGGRALNDELRKRMKYAAFCDSMQHLESFAETFRNATGRTDA